VKTTQTSSPVTRSAETALPTHRTATVGRQPASEALDDGAVQWLADRVAQRAPIQRKRIETGYENLTDTAGPLPRVQRTLPRVQRTRSPSPQHETGRIHEAARLGTSGASRALPYLDAIQPSFGRYDVRGVAAHTGAAAQSGAGAMSALAFTMGNHVAFAATPTLHTAAHEAAHVIQQRAGVQLSGGVGEVGDPHEKHADAVADMVVAGRSSEALLRQHVDPFGPSEASEAERSHGVNSGPVKASTRSETAAAGATPGAQAYTQVQSRHVETGYEDLVQAACGRPNTYSSGPLLPPIAGDKSEIHPAASQPVRVVFTGSSAPVSQMIQQQKATDGGTSDVAAELAKRIAKVNEMIVAARAKGANGAAENLEYWLSGKNGTKMMKASQFQNEDFVNSWLSDRPRSRFISGAVTRYKDGRLTVGGDADMEWTDSLTAPLTHDLFYALGGFTILSRVRVHCDRVESGRIWDTVYFSFKSWQCEARDTYNWDAGKSTYIPGFGSITDEWMKYIEDNGSAKAFNVSSDPWTVTNAAVTATFDKWI
jgi:hypothetical protein